MTPHAEKTREIIRLVARFPIEEFQQGRLPDNKRPDDHVLFKANDWQLTVGDVRKAREL